MERTIALDFETFYSEEYSVKTLGAKAYCADPRFDAYMISVYDGEQGWAGHPRDFNWSALEGAFLLSHNAAFDRQVHAALARDGKAPALGDIGCSLNRWQCTANLSAYMAGAARRSLKDASEFLLGVKVAKQVRNWAKGKSWEDMLSLYPTKVQGVLDYALGDVYRCFDIWRLYHEDWPEIEQRLSLITMTYTDGGVGVNQELLERHLKQTSVEKWEAENKLPWVIRGEKPGSWSALAQECRNSKIPVPPLKKDDADAFEEWEEAWGGKHDWVRLVSQHRKLCKMHSTLEMLKARLLPVDFAEPAVYVETPLKYFGAGTGRWAGDQLNFQNLRKKPLALPSGYEIDIRELFVARPGFELFVADFAQIEPRVLAWLCGDFKFLEMVAKGFAVYEAHARETMGWTGGVLKEENPAMYALAKARVLGLGYGCGHKKFVAVAKAMAGLDLSKEESKEIVDKFRAQNPKITALWGQFDDLLQETIDKHRAFGELPHLEVSLPSGRILRYLNVHRRKVIRNQQSVDPDGVTTIKQAGRFEIFADYGGKSKSIYGGLLTENLVQATARDVFAETLVALHDAEFHVPFHTHDEFVVEVPIGTPDEAIVPILRRCPTWLKGCPIDIEYKRASHYFK